MQYTLRNIPKLVDRALRKKAKAEGKSLNDAAIEAMKTGLKVSAEPVRHNDLDFVAGTWVEDPEFDKAVQEQHRIDPEMWE